MSANFIFLTLFFIISWGLYAAWIWRENQKLAYQWQLELDNFAAHKLKLLIKNRTIQMLSILLFFAFVTAAYALKADRTEARLDRALSTQSALQQTVEKLEIRLREKTAKKAAATEKAQAKQNKPQEFYPGSRSKTVAPVTAEKTGIEAVYNPEDSAPGNPSAMDRMKKRYEDLLVNYMFLKKCGHAQEADYHIITSALSQEMASVNAPGRLQHDVLTSAQGSYNEMYSNSDCNAPEVAALLKGYKDYIAAISRDFVAPPAAAPATQAPAPATPQ